jgi:hypothetical protein
MQPYLALITPLSSDGSHPDQGLPGGGGHPGNWVPGAIAGRPDNSLPGGRPEHPWWGGGSPNRPDNSLPDGAQPKGLHAGVQASAIPPKPTAPAAVGEWVLVALGDGEVNWAWMGDPAPTPAPKKA